MIERFRAYLISIRNIIFSFNFIKLSLILWPRKLVNYVQSELFFFKTLTNSRKLIQKNIYDVLPIKKEFFDITINLPNKWFFPDSSYTKDIITLCLFCKILNPKVIFEIGTFDGFSALHFALNTSEETKIFTLDLPKEVDKSPELNLTYIDKIHIKAYEKKQNLIFQNRIAGNKIHCLYGDSYEFDYSPYHNKVDFFFIDGAHSYDYVRSDTLNALNCVRRGGVMAWHDYGRVGVNGVSKWLHKLAKKHEIFSVPGSSLAFMVIK